MKEQWYKCDECGAVKIVEVPEGATPSVKLEQSCEYCGGTYNARD